MLAVAVFCVVLGSSSAPELVGPGRKLRWAALAVLALVALALAAGGRRQPVGVLLLVAFGIGAALCALAVVSTAWSVDPRLTFGRAGSFVLALLTVAGLAIAAQSRPGLARGLLVGILAAVSAVAVGGLVLLALDHGEAVQAATFSSPPRYRGLGENPDTVAILFGLAAPIGLWLILSVRTPRTRLVGAAALALLVGSIVASGSRGGLLAAVVGCLVLAALWPQRARRRIVIAATVLACAVAGTVVSQIPQPLQAEPTGTASTPPASSSAGSGTVAGSIPSPRPSTDAFYEGALSDELAPGNSDRRSLFGSSGRVQAWQGALRQADARPILGYGFGTENKVFVDRFHGFQGSYVENSVIGLYLQLGAVGLVTFLGLLFVIGGAAVAGALRAFAPTAPEPALAGMLAAGGVLMLVQSYAYSVGDVATLAFWVAGALAVALRSRTPKLPVARAGAGRAA